MALSLNGPTRSPIQMVIQQPGRSRRRLGAVAAGPDWRPFVLFADPSHTRRETTPSILGGCACHPARLLAPGATQASQFGLKPETIWASPSPSVSLSRPFRLQKREERVAKNRRESPEQAMAVCSARTIARRQLGRIWAGKELGFSHPHPGTSAKPNPGHLWTPFTEGDSGHDSRCRSCCGPGPPREKRPAAARLGRCHRGTTDGTALRAKRRRTTAAVVGSVLVRRRRRHCRAGRALRGRTESMQPRPHPGVRPLDVHKSALNASALQRHFSSLLQLGSHHPRRTALSGAGSGDRIRARASSNPRSPARPGLGDGTDISTDDSPDRLAPLSLAQKLGLVPAPDAPLSASDWKYVEEKTRQRGDFFECCAICHQKLGADDQVLLSCSHVFHKRCIQSYERYVSEPARSCPLCRAQHYQKRLTDEGTAAFRMECAVRIQSCFRGFLARREATRLRMAKDPALKKRVLGQRLSRVGDRLRSSVNRTHRSVDAFLEQIDRSVARARLSAISDVEWRLAERMALDRKDEECPICMGDLRSTGTAGSSDLLRQDRAVVLTSCSHVFHEICLHSFEQFVAADPPTLDALRNDQAQQMPGSTVPPCSCPVCRSSYIRRPFVAGFGMAAVTATATASTDVPPATGASGDRVEPTASPATLATKAPSSTETAPAGRQQRRRPAAPPRPPGRPPLPSVSATRPSKHSRPS